MKRSLIVLFVFALSYPFLAQNNLSEANKSKALRKGEAEAKLYTKKGMKNMDASQSMHDALVSFYELVYTGKSASDRTYVWGAGEGKSADPNKAYNKGLADAINHIPGLMASYFNMWILASDLSEKDKTHVQHAIQAATNAFTTKILDMEPFRILHLKGEKKGTYKSHVRVLFNQAEVRSLCRKEIKVFLKEETGWSDEKMTKVLTFEH